MDRNTGGKRLNVRRSGPGPLMTKDVQKLVGEGKIWGLFRQYKVLPLIYSSSRCCLQFHCPACRTYLIATRFWVVVICPIIKCLTVLEFFFILFDLRLFITIFNFILNYVPIVTFWIFAYHKIWILLIIICFIWNYWIVYFLTCLEVFWSVVS